MLILEFLSILGYISPFMTSIVNFFRGTCCGRRPHFRDIDSISDKSDKWSPCEAVTEFLSWKTNFVGHGRISAIWGKINNLDEENCPNQLTQSQVLLVWLSEDLGCKEVSTVERLRKLAHVLRVPCPSLEIFNQICVERFANEEEAKLIAKQFRLEQEQKRKELSSIGSL